MAIVEKAGKRLSTFTHLLAISSVATAFAFVIATSLAATGDPSPNLSAAEPVDFELVQGATRQVVLKPILEPPSLADSDPALVIVSTSGDPIPSYERPTPETLPSQIVPVGPSGETVFLAVQPIRQILADWADLTIGGEWIEVYLPVRPNESTGWIKLKDTKLHANTFRVEVDRAGFSLTVFDSNEIVFKTEVAIGTGDTPTPAGRFYTTELIDTTDPTGPYGPFAFALSGYSETIFDFNGGPGIIGVHGTNDPTAIGSAVSFGCIRVDNDVIEYMAETLPLGTPIEIT